MRLARLAPALRGAPILFAFALAGCYETPRPACAFACSADGDCPDGYSCRADTWCKLDDVADDFECAPPLPDAASSDAGGTTADASPDASAPDAAPDDAAPDASPLDASPDAGEGAMSITASGSAS